MGLNLDATNHLGKWHKYEVLLRSNNGAVVLRSVFNTVADNFALDMVAIGKVSERANKDLSGMTEAKNMAKKTGSERWGDIAANVYGFAAEKKLKALQTQMRNCTAAKLVKIKDVNWVSMSNNLNKAFKKLLVDYSDASDYFTLGELATAMTAAGEFERSMGKWAVANADVNGAKKEFKNKWMPRIAERLEVMEKLLSGAIKQAFPRFARSFIKMKKLDYAGVKNQGVMVKMADAATGEVFVLNGKMMTMNYNYGKLQKTGVTNSLGLFKVMRLMVGNWTIRFSVEGYVEQFIVVKIVSKKVLKLKVDMVSVADN